MPKIEIEYQCKACSGTGLYKGMAEHDGAAIVCNTCEGTGKAVLKFEYQEFDGRILDDTKRVYRTNPGIGIGINDDPEADDGICCLEDFGGITYEDWLILEDPQKFPLGTEMRKYTCPAWWYQSADYDKKPDWDMCIRCGSFRGCKCFSQKEHCWARFDDEMKDK